MKFRSHPGRTMRHEGLELQNAPTRPPSRRGRSTDRSTCHTEHGANIAKLGKGISSPHRSGDKDDEKLGITVSLDYCFMTHEEKSEDVPPVLVMWDSNHEACWALPVEAKGPVDYVVQWCTDKLYEAGSFWSADYDKVRSGGLYCKPQEAHCPQEESRDSSHTKPGKGIKVQWRYGKGD